jgi:predicted MFS family arabinose efflux permease
VTLSLRQAAGMFLAFALTYFFSALLRAVTATLAPAFSAELGLGAADLGLLAGAYFFGFAALQLPMGQALDRWGPRRTLLSLLGVAVLGCAAFAQAQTLAGLIASRVLIGAGVSACLMAPLTSYRRYFSPAAQLRANSWMLMTGSLGMLASTLPVQWLLPWWGWRGLFWGLALMLLMCIALLSVLLPGDVAHDVPHGPEDQSRLSGPQGATGGKGYASIVRHPMFQRLAPLAFVMYGGMIAVQALWAGPWLTQVGGASADAAAHGLFAINLAMLVAFMAWGIVMPRLARRGITAAQLLTWGTPLALALLALNISLGPRAGPAHWAAWCVACTFISLSQPALAQAFAPHQAGRALSAYNLLIFGGVFSVQWGLGLVIDALQHTGIGPVQSFQWAFGAFGTLCVGAYLWFLARRPLRRQTARE